MDISLVRVDNRLVHGQILEAWVPFVKATRIVVADDDVANDFFRESVIRMAVPSEMEVTITTIEEFSQHYKDRENKQQKTIILFSNIGDVLRAVNRGFKFNRLNIGNIYSDHSRTRCSNSVLLDENDIRDIKALLKAGIRMELQRIPRDKPIDIRQALNNKLED
ncbi:MAG: PTS sugar transporter subunit IIB [Deltaproteobacteria bacterium]|nr:PTS sugar transporter subunit IIB [Deltaproteobacteria bacterium]